MTADRAWFRHIVGIIAILGGLGGLAGLYLLPIPEGNREPLLLALGLVLGWGGTVMSYEFGSSPAGRQAAAVGIRQAAGGAPDADPSTPAGTQADPVIVAGAPEGSPPVRTTPEEEPRP